MKTTAWHWLVLLAIPGCLLVQPLDEAKPDDAGGAGSAGKSSSSQAGSAGKGSQTGSAGQHSGGSGPAAGGMGNRAGSGSVPAPGGAANGGAASGVDFSLFLGDWTITGGKGTLVCDVGGTSTTTIPAGGVDTFALGTISDLIFDPGNCEALMDVNDRTASLNPATSDCSYTSGNYTYDLSYLTFQFVVSGNGQTAKAAMTTSVDVYDASDTFISTCANSYTWDYSLGGGAR